MPQDAQSTTTDIEYVHIEMVFKQEAKYEVISGLLQGLKVKEGVTFILLHGQKKTLNIISMGFYNIMTIEVLHKDNKDMTHLTSHDKDQKLALKMVKDLYQDLLKDRACSGKDSDLIDIGTYINVPDEYSNPKANSAQKQQDNTHHVQHNNAGGYTRTTVEHTKSYHYEAAEKKKLEPGVFGRTSSKKPSKANLALMQEKIDQINAGTFECVIPKTPEDSQEDPDGTNVINLYEDGYHWT